MAEGRMIVKGIGRDPRIRGLSETAQRLWPYVLPHTEFGGILPREAHELRLACFPEWKLTDEQVEASIIEWLKTKPPMAQEITTRGGNKRLALTDFGKCNEHLVFNAERQRRWREKHKVTLRTVSNGSNGSNARSEVKRSEEKNNSLYIKSFDRFWEAYPRKEGRKPALEAWLKLRPEEETVTLLLQALLRYKSSAAVRRGIVFAPARWLAEERWTDEVKDEGNGDPIYA